MGSGQFASVDEEVHTHAMLTYFRPTPGVSFNAGRAYGFGTVCATNLPARTNVNAWAISDIQAAEVMKSSIAQS